MGTLVFQATLGGAINLIGPNTASTVNFTLPSADGTNGQALTTNGSGTLAFTTVTATPGGSTTQVQYNNGGVFGGITGATTNGTALTLVAPNLGTPASGVVTNLTGTASININGTVGATTANTGAFTSISSTLGINTPNTFGFKNRIINGNMGIDQRNAGASVTLSADTYVLDRYKGLATQASKLSVQQNAGSVTPPAGFINYMGFTSLSAYSIGAGDIFGFDQRIEGLNAIDLAWGTASASSVTLSFWVRSSLTGTFGGSLANSASTRSYPYTYTISVANTWEQKSITIAGDTSGTWLTTNGIGIRVQFGLGVGSTYSGTAGAWATANYVSSTGATSVVGTSGATFYITGIQLEKGSTATSFDVRPYATELALCQRYLPAFTNGGSNGYIAPVFIFNSTGGIAIIPFQVPTRVKPTGVTINNLDLMVDGTANFNVSAAVFNTSTPFSASLTLTISGATAGQSGGLLCETSTNILFTGCEL